MIRAWSAVGARAAQRVASARVDTDAGSAVVEFTLVAPLVIAVALGVLQVALGMYVRTSLVSAASQGARAAALAGADASVGEQRVRDLVDGTLSGSVVRDVDVTSTRAGGLPVIDVRIDARVPGIALLGAGSVTVHGHAVREDLS